MVNDMKSRTITRRTALKTAVGSLIGIGSTTGLVSSASGEKMVKFPSLVSGTEVDKWLKVPKVWYEHQRHASNVHTRLKSRIQNTPGIKQTQLVRSPKKYGGVNGLKIEVIGNSNSDFQYNLPSEVEGVPISGTSLESQPELACIDDSNHCTNYETDDWLRPGEYVDEGTAGSRVIMPSGEKRMLTAAHLFHDGDACNIADHDLVGRNANVYGGNKVGEVATADVSADYVTIEKADGGHWSSKIDNNNSTTHEIEGYVTKDTLKYWTGLSNPPCLHSMGCTTDHTQGEIKATEVSDTGFFSSCLDWDGEGVKTWCTAGSGDSGSPTYHTYWSKEYLVSLTCAHAADVNAVYCNGELKNKGGASWGSGAYHIKNLESNSNGDLQFGTGDYGGI